MPHAIQIRQTGASEVLNWTAIDVGEPASYPVRLRQAAAAELAHAHGFLRSLDCLRPRGLMVTFGQASGPIDPIAPVPLSQKGSLFLTRPFLFHYIERRDALETSANELFEVVASGKVRINVNQRFALKDAAAHNALEARAT
jgi:NADPH:quinone reductase-like Zn-dependent oxidoreductase